jgi:O-antigen/teichoic acid export membrane protein
MMWPYAVGLVISIGLQQAFAYAVGAEWAKPARLRQMALKYTLLVGLPAMFVYVLLCPYIFQRQFPNNVRVAQSFALFIPLSLYVSLILPIYQGSGDFKTFNISRLLRVIAWTLWVVVLTIWARLTVFNLLVAQLVNLVILAAFLTSRRGHLKRQTTGEGTTKTASILKYGFGIYLSAIAYTVNQSLDQLFLSLWVKSADLGQYATAVSLSGLVLIMPSAVGPIVFSKLAREDGQKSQQRRHMRLALLFAIALMIPLAFGLALLGPRLTQLLYGVEFVKAGQLLRVLAPAAIFLGIAISVSEILRGVGKPMYATYAALIGGVVTIAGLAWALPRYGIWGAAWVSFAAYGFMMLVEILLLWRWSGDNIDIPREEPSVSSQVNVVRPILSNEPLGT